MENKELKNYAIVLASGTGERFGGNIPKQFAKINDKTILENSLDIFEQNDGISGIILVITPEYRDLAEKIVNGKYKKLLKILDGGLTRKDSSFIGVNSIKEAEANVLIHDCARPFLSQGVLNKCLDALKKYEAVDVAIPVTDTVMTVENGFIKNIPPRKTIFASQTPQCFRLSLIKKAHELSNKDIDFTDDCGLVQKYNLAQIYILEGERGNIKITFPHDIQIAKILKN